MRRRVALAVLGVFAACAPGAPPAERGVEVVEARLVAPAGDAPAALYLTLINRTSAVDSLVAVSLEGAERTEIHETMQHGGMMHMTPVPGVALPVGETVRMAPGALHVMVFGSEAVLPGDTVAGLVELRHGGSVPIRAVVISYADLVSAAPDSGGAR